MDERDLKNYRDLALDLTAIWIEGVLRDYVHKQSGGKTLAASVKPTHKRKTRRERKKAAKEKARGAAKKRKAKEDVAKRNRLEHYYGMESTEH